MTKLTYDAYSPSTISVDDIRRAWQARDPDLAGLIVRLAGAKDRPLDQPAREGALTLDGFLSELRSNAFKARSRDERASTRRATLAALQASDAEVELPERFGLSTVIMEIWQANGPFERQALVDIIESVPLRWGAWLALKQIFKDAEERGDFEIFGALAARFDSELSHGKPSGEVTRRTLAYLVRRAWRRLRRQAELLPSSYPDAACAVLRFYPNRTNWARTWVYNHVLHHESGAFTRRRFTFKRSPKSLLTQRAYVDLWRLTPRPLFSLLERAESEQVRRYATTALKTDFRAAWREVEPSWVVRLIGVPSATVHEFAIWVLENAPRFEQGAFVELGLHQPVLQLLDSPSEKAQAFAAAYARTHARDLPLDRLIELANNEHDDVRKLARDLLFDRDPRTDVGLEAWGRLLGTEYGHELAVEALRKHFGARELTPAWFAERLLSGDDEVFEFAVEHLHRVHKPKALGVGFYVQLLDDERLDYQAAEFALEQLAGSAAELDPHHLRRWFVRPRTWSTVVDWVDEGRIEASVLGTDLLKAAAYHPGWEAFGWLEELAATYRWARDLDFQERRAARVLEWLADVRKFSPDELGFDWLMELVARSESNYHGFAVDYMSRAFLPADFAPGAGAAPPEPEPSGAINIDLGGASFLFTGKLKTMTRGEAQKKVTAAGGSKASGVNAKLDYLVIGDEGSPLYGEGRKGSKQVKAEKLIDDGAPLRIISETAFLQMLAGEQREFSDEAVTEGCERLWALATAGADASEPLARFALRYLRTHHKDIGLALTDRPVDPGAEIPDAFLSFERVRPLLTESRSVLRSFGLELARWEFARWAPPMTALVELFEAAPDDTRDFVIRALLADENPEHKRYRVAPEQLTADAVYSFCESLDAPTRGLGMQLIDREPRLAIPEELFRLTESPDRKVRAFVIRTLWGLYHARGITAHWKPAPPPAKPKDKRRKAPEKVEEPAGPTPRPDAPPAARGELRDFLRRVLYTVPPARLPKEKGPRGTTLPKLSARKAKLALIETLRDLAIDDIELAELLVPELRAFKGSRGMSERDACIVALTRIGRAHPALATWSKEVD